MWKDILITDVTRMREGRVCIAGVDKDYSPIRLNVPPPGLLEELLYLDKETIIRPQSVLRVFVEPEPQVTAPHIEDHRWYKLDETQFLRLTTEEKWKHFFEATQYDKVADIFGTSLHERRNIKAGISNTRSLGTLKPNHIKKFFLRKLPNEIQIRFSFTDATERTFDVPVTDLNFLSYVTWTHQHSKKSIPYILGQLCQKFQNIEIWLRMGLTRPFNNWCWIQVNGIYTFPDYLDGRCFIGLV
jgi:hypothetical protein